MALDRKKAELKTLSDKLAKAEASNRSPLATAGALIRSGGADALEPIWVDGLHYPAQYLIRHTRSMSARQPTEFTLASASVEQESLEAHVESSEGAVCQLYLLGAVLVGCNTLSELLQCDNAVAVVWRNGFTLLLSSQQTGPRIVWQECVPVSW